MPYYISKYVCQDQDVTAAMLNSEICRYVDTNMQKYFDGTLENFLVLQKFQYKMKIKLETSPFYFKRILYARSVIL